MGCKLLIVACYVSCIEPLFLVVVPLQYNGNNEAPCGTCKSSPIEKIFYEHTFGTNWNTSRTQTDR